MDTKTMTIDTNKRYIVQSYEDDNIYVIEFAEPQDIYPEEEYLGMFAYECYILDDEYEAERRAIYYYDRRDETQYLKFREDPEDPDSDLITVTIRKMVVDGIEEEEPEEPESNLSMGDIC